METIKKQIIEDVPMFNIPFQGHDLDSHYGSMRAFFPSKSGKFLLSVVGGVSNYCEPRELLKDPKDYVALEVAIFDAINGGWASTKSLQDAGAFDIIGMGEHQLTTYDEEDNEVPRTDEQLAEPSCSVFGWVDPVDVRRLWANI